MVLILSMEFLYAKNSSSGRLVSKNHSSGLSLYFVNRSSQLKRLTLYSCNMMWGRVLAEAMKKVPQLEELHLYNMETVYALDMETIGKACPMLKSFTFNLPGIKNLNLCSPHRFKRPCRICNNGCALAIAENMPNLHHLCLFSQPLNDKGLEAILDGCPHLESLDLRQCFHLDGTLSKRCYEQIKDVKCPFESIKDMEWLKSSIDSEFDCSSYELAVGYGYCESFDDYNEVHNAGHHASCYTFDDFLEGSHAGGYRSL